MEVELSLMGSLTPSVTSFFPDPLDLRTRGRYNRGVMVTLLNIYPARPVLSEREREGELCLRGGVE